MGILKLLKDFAGGTSIHGLGFMVHKQSSTLKKFTWALLFLAAILYASLELRVKVTCKLLNHMVGCKVGH